MAHMLLAQKAAPNSPQWFNTGLNFAYGMTGPDVYAGEAAGYLLVDPTERALTAGMPAVSRSKLLAMAIPKNASQSAGWRSDETRRVLNRTNRIMSRQ